MGKNGSKYNCAEAGNTIGDIIFRFKLPVENWSQTKEITIDYNVKNYIASDKIEYSYVYSGNYEVKKDNGLSIVPILIGCSKEETRQ